MTGAEARLAALEARLAVLEDRVAICQLMALYGPAADGGAAAAAAGLWTEDGQYLMADLPLDGRAAMLDGPRHQAVIATGSGHVASLPWIRIEGDRAVALCHSRLYLKDGEGYRVARVSANRWHFARTPEGWRVTRRISHLLDGGDAARRVFGDAVAGLVRSDDASPASPAP